MNYYLELIQRGLGNRIRSLRRQRKWTQERLAEEIGESNRYISIIECGKANITLKTLIRMANVFDVSPSYLLGGVSEKDEQLEQELLVSINLLSDRDKAIVKDLLHSLLSQ